MTKPPGEGFKLLKKWQRQSYSKETNQDLPVQAGLPDLNGEDGGGVVVGAGVHVKMEPVVAAADRGDRWAGHRVRREVGGGTLAVVCGSQGMM